MRTLALCHAVVAGALLLVSPAHAQSGRADALTSIVSTEGGLNRQIVTRVLQRLRGGLDRCVGADREGLEGGARFALLVGEDGRPDSVTVTREAWTTQASRRCFERALTRARFPRADAPTRVTVTYWIGSPASALLGASGGTAQMRGGAGGLGSRGTGVGGGGTGRGSLFGAGSGGGLGSGSGQARPRPQPGPAGQLRPGQPTVQGSLQRQVIQRVVRTNRSALRYCYERELMRQPDLAGRLVVSFTIAPNGTVSTVRATESSLSSPAIEGCVMRQIRRWRFPQPSGGGIVVVSYPFEFRPRAAAR